MANPENNESRQTYGLHQVWPKPQESQSGANIGRKILNEVDIIVLHGLSASSPKTWTAWKVDGDRKSGDVNWLCDPEMLPAKMPTARILTYDWNANCDANAADDIFLSHAKSLLANISINRKNRGGKEVPIIFIASCFGGLLLAKALLQATLAYNHRQQEYSMIIDSTIGILFLGTPFQGASKSYRTAAELRLEVAKQAAAEEEAQHSSELMLYLQNGSRDHGGQLNELVEQLTNFLSFRKETPQKIPVVCFFERNDTSNKYNWEKLPKEYQERLEKHGHEVVVDHQSASLQGWESLGLDVRHSMLHKYNSPTDASFMHVVDRLQNFLEQHRTKPRAQITDCAPQATRSHNPRTTLTSYAKLLSVKEAERREGDLDRTPVASGTCQWIFDNEEYKRWFFEAPIDPEFGLCIIEGKAGCGKSTLMRQIVKKAKQQSELRGEVCFSYFFDAGNGTTLQNSLQGFYRHILHQVLGEVPPTDELDQIVKAWGNPPDSLRDCEERIKQVSGALYQRHIRIFVDAIDECTDSRGTRECIEDMLGFLKMLRNDELKVALCLTLREARYAQQYSTTERVISVDRWNAEDIRAFVLKRFQRHEGSERSAFHRNLASAILDRSRNVFLWVKIVVGMLQGITEKDISKAREIIRSLPPQLEVLYEGFLKKLDSDKRAEAVMLLQLVRVSTRPLRWREVMSALRYSNDGNRTAFKPSAEEFEDTIHSLCGGLVEFGQPINQDGGGRSWLSSTGTSGQESTQFEPLVQFTHYSVREFLEKCQWLCENGQLKPSSLAEAHWQISRLCIRTVDLDEDDEHLTYARQFWYTHAREGYEAIQEREEDCGLPSFVLQCGRSTKRFVKEYKQCVEDSSITNYRGKVQRINITNTRLLREEDRMLALLAFEGCTGLVTMHAKSCKQADMCYRNAETLEVAIFLAASRGWVHTIREILRIASDNSIAINVSNLHPVQKMAPLQIACLWGHKEAVKLLLDIESNDARITRNQLLAFRTMSSKGNLDIMELFKRGNRRYPQELLETQDSNGFTALHCAAQEGQKQTFMTLIDELDDSAAQKVIGLKTARGRNVAEAAEWHRNKALNSYRKKDHDVSNFDKIIKKAKDYLE